MIIKKYLQFISEELITGLPSTGKDSKLGVKKINQETSNVFKDLFTNDPLKLKEYLQTLMPNQNLKFIGSGAIGLAFIWQKSNQPLPDEFWSNIIGDKMEGQDLIIKFTADENEAEGAKKLISLKGTEGFAKYFWMKEFELPEANWWSATLGPQAPWQAGKKDIKGQRTRMDDILPHWPELANPDEIKKVSKERGKHKKAYIICLEKLEMPTDKQKLMATTLYQLLTLQMDSTKKFLKLDNNDENKLSQFWDWFNSQDVKPFDAVNPEFSEMIDSIKSDHSLKKKRFQKSEINTDFKSVSKDEFLDFTNEMLNLFRIGISKDVPTTDIHGENIGIRNGKLVAFDCM